VVKVDTDASVYWRLLSAWTHTMQKPAYFGMILTQGGCGGHSFCPPVGCTDFSNSCWVYMQGGLYGFSKVFRTHGLSVAYLWETKGAEIGRGGRHRPLSLRPAT